MENRHKTVRCNVCGKRMRSDNLRRHAQAHKDILAMTDDEVRDELREELLHHNQGYLDKIELGKHIAAVRPCQVDFSVSIPCEKIECAMR